jgi:SAM-dependent methyltransferase
MKPSAIDELFGVLDPELVGSAAQGTCASCGTGGLYGFYEVSDIPAQSNVLLDTSAAAEEFGGAQMLLAFCPRCGFIQNARFDPSMIDYSLPTEESQAFSDVFNRYMENLADDLVARHDLVDRTVLEVGSGKGDFLALLADRGIRRGVGIDPGFLPDRGPSRSNLEFRREYLGPGPTVETPSLIVARHLLEHIPDVDRFMILLKSSMTGTGGALFIEVPDTSRILREAAFWDVYYEHCSYFTLSSLRTAILSAGMSLSELRLAFDDQYIHATAQLAGGLPRRGVSPEEEVLATARDVVRFARSLEASLETWRDRVRRTQEDGGEVAIWGASSKAVAFIAALEIEQPIVVDINPHKQDKWLPGVAVEVLAPERLESLRPQLVIPMNPVYTREIDLDLRAMGLRPAVEPLRGEPGV